MQDVIDRNASVACARPTAPRYDDPLDHDSAEDAPVLTTRRSLVRLALVAAETGSRFVREEIDIDPVAWMLAPRRLFDDRPAIDACLDREECLRAVLLHGLAIGLDADPTEIDALAADEDEDEGMMPVISDEAPECPQLWTSFLVGRSHEGCVQAFDAILARTRQEAEARLRARHGGGLSDDLEILKGFDASLPLAEALVSPALADMLKQVATDPGSPLAEGLSISVQQRFIA